MQFQACAYCDHPNPVGTNYCNDCGAALHLKPCRNCGAIAAAQARHCPACQAAFPVRPMVDVDIPWAVPADWTPVAGRSPAASNATSTEPRRTVADTGDASPAMLATKRLLEKAAERAGERADAKALVLPPRFDRPRGDAGHDFLHAEREAHAAMRTCPVDPAPAAPIELAILAPRLAEGSSRRSQVIPVIVLSVLGLVVAVALLFLIDYAAMRDRVREVALPLKILHPGIATSTSEAGTGATARDTDVAPAANARTTGDGREPDSSVPTSALAGAAAAGASAAAAAAASSPSLSTESATADGASAANSGQASTVALPPSSTASLGTTSGSDSTTAAHAPAQDNSVPPAVPGDSAACRTELQALGLCNPAVR